MAAVLKRSVRLVLVGALLSGLDVPAALAQGGAWAVMLARGLRSRPVAQAVAETFDGSHPCAVCLRLRRAESGPSLRAAPSSARPDLFRRPAAAAPAIAVVAPRAPLAFSALAAAEPPPLTPPPDTRAA
jgi:hypothetical protein